jgi:Skp family chaperone for outer membrane proteins
VSPRARLGAALAAALLAAPAPAQEPAQARPFVVLSQDRILTDSRAGQALIAEETAARDRLRAEARSIDQAFEQEERRLTDLRPTLEPPAFRELADAFDARVVEARREQDARSVALAQEFDEKRRQFYAGVAPILAALMARSGALAIFDENSVLMVDQSLDITDAVIAEIDAAFDAGRLAPAAPEAAPAAPTQGD